MKTFIITSCLLVAFLFSSCGIYKMPSDDTYSVIPKTNNPAFIKDNRATAATPNQASF